MWQTPWKFPEGIVVVCGIVIVGYILQFTINSFKFYLLAFPANLFVGGIIVLLCTALSFLRKTDFVKWFSGVPLSVVLIAALLILTLIMGLTPQSSEVAGSLFSRIGFTQMTSSWPFVLIYLTTLLSLGCLIACKLHNFKRKDYAFYINHIGLWLVLFASGLGHADMERYVMHVREGETEWRVYDYNENIKELPIAIKLNDFDMEEYPPKLTVINRQTGVPQPEENPQYYQIDTKVPEGHLNGWTIKLEEYIHQAVRNSDSTYREVPMPGATPAAFISVVNNKTGEKHKGWVCGGNQAQLYMTLPLDDELCVVMTVPEPKKFMSDIEVYIPDGTVKQALLEVNKPLRIGHWTVYQYGYDNKAGRLSSYSSMELVYDPWIVPVYIGFLLIALGAIAMLWKGKKVSSGNKEENDII
jgi:hypothetical protein